MTRAIRRPLLFAALLSILTMGCAVATPAYEAVTRRRYSAGIDVNHATVEELAHLPEVSTEDAERIVARRPYATKMDLVQRGVLSAEQLQAIQDRIFVGVADAS
ncbi:MAG TPA: helix-hairpin-helix domain-containing protein, partial [Candidatus Binatia bacterium]|nr:helix-hairpin-helix domain-containing protein [Candidatus Binatia bacterium]